MQRSQVGGLERMRLAYVILRAEAAAEVEPVPSLPEGMDQREAISAGMSGAIKTYWVYIMSGRTKTLYVGVTNDLERRDYEHKTKSVPGFSSKYTLDRLVYVEEHADIRDAIEREKQIKSWRREKKLLLIESLNPKWQDLSFHWNRRESHQNSDKSLRVDPSASPRRTRLRSG